MSFLINFCFNSYTDPFCLALQLQAPCLQRLALRSRHDSLSFSSLYVIVFIMFLMLILLSLTLHAFSHNADRRGNTKGRGNWGGVEWKISREGKKNNNFLFCFPPQAVYLRTVQLENPILNLSTRLISIFSFLWQLQCKRRYSFQAHGCYQTLERGLSKIVPCNFVQLTQPNKSIRLSVAFRVKHTPNGHALQTRVLVLFTDSVRIPEY